MDCGWLFSFVFQVDLYICKRLTLCSLYARVTAVECETQLFMVVTLLIFLYFLVLSWAGLPYCFLKLNIAIYFFIDDM